MRRERTAVFPAFGAGYARERGAMNVRTASMCCSVLGNPQETAYSESYVTPCNQNVHFPQGKQRIRHRRGHGAIPNLSFPVGNSDSMQQQGRAWSGITVLPTGNCKVASHEESPPAQSAVSLAETAILWCAMPSCDSNLLFPLQETVK